MRLNLLLFSHDLHVTDDYNYGGKALYRKRIFFEKLIVLSGVKILVRHGGRWLVHPQPFHIQVTFFECKMIKKVLDLNNLHVGG